jgi:hypothetical protein
MFTPDQRYQKFKDAPEKIQALYDSNATAAFLHSVMQGYVADTKEGIEIIGDCIIGLYKIADLPRIFQQKLKVSADESQRITSQLIEFLAPVVHREEEEGNVKKEEISKLTQTFAKPEGLATAPVAQYEDVVEPIRTMSGDMNRVHGYGAYRAQDADDIGPTQSDGGGGSSD